MSNAHLWQQIYYLYLLSVFSLFLTTADIVGTKHLTFCGQQSNHARSLIFVSTLDGKISAINAANHGKKEWTLDFNDGPMLSSNIHRRELNNNGQWVRLIPSLKGGLYKFDGENLETVPISTDQLLHSSFRFSDNLVFSGGKEIHSYGVAINTGKILYECNINECMNHTDRESHMGQEILIIQRLQQTVRAVEPRTGVERWNYSVGQHELVLVPPTDIYCPNKITALDIEIKVVIPEGLIWAVNKSNPTVKLWQHKFDNPIVTIWREDASSSSSEERSKNSLEEMNLFNSSQWIWGSDYSTISPSLYVGMHNRQLYIQENSELENSLDSSPKYFHHVRYPWQPYPAIETALINSVSSEHKDEASIETTEVQSTTALSVLYNSEYINGNGFYLYPKEQLNANEQCNRTITVIDIEKPLITYPDEENDTPVQIITISLWYWWKEVLIISITTAFLLNFMLTQRLLNATTVAKDAILPPLIIERPVDTKKSTSTNDDNNVTNGFKSRYLTDFEPVDCLGKGGYGVVFEAKNKIDDCNYAIKRIVLPNSRDSRERVMREVKALAKLDHRNIVRYFNAWLECPPAGWQEDHDRQWINKQKLPSSNFPSESTQTETKPNDSVCIDVSQTDPSSVDSAREALELNNVEINDDSFIVFENSNETQRNNSAVWIDNCSTERSYLSSPSNKTNKGLQISDVNDSKSIVFEKLNDELLEEKHKHKRQKSAFSLDLDNKVNDRKSTKIFLYIQMQLCQRLSLREWLKQQLSTRDRLRGLNIFQQIIDAVEYVHLQGLIHRDLKPSNIFFAYDDKIKIGDFGLVTAMTEGRDGAHTPGAENENTTLKNSIHTAHVGTHLYMSPEQMNGQVYNYKVDIYSLGIIFLELLIPFSTDMERVIALSNLKKSIFPKNFAEDYPAEYNLLKMMLDQDPIKRPTTLGIKARPPLQNYEISNGYSENEDSKWHFELPQLTRHSSVTSSSSSNESYEIIS